MIRLCIAMALLLPPLLGCRDEPDRPAPPPEAEPAEHSRPSAAPVEVQPNRIALAAGERLGEFTHTLTDRQRWRNTSAAILSGFERSVRAVAMNGRVHLSAGKAAMRRGEADFAVGCFRRAVESAPDKAEFQRHLAVALTTAGRHQEAADAYRRVVELGDGDPTAAFNLAVALTRLGRLGEAERTYKELLGEHGDFVEAWYNLATLQQSRKHLSDAAESWREVVRLRPAMASAHRSLGEVLSDLGQTEEAMEAFSEAVKLKPDDPTSWANLALSAEAAGSLGRSVVAARRAFDTADRTGTSDASLHAKLGNLLLRLHRRLEEPELLTDAVACWRASLAGDPDQPELRRLVELYGPVADQSADPAGD